MLLVQNQGLQRREGVGVGAGRVGCNGDKVARVGLGSPQAQVDAPWWSLRRLGICSSSCRPSWLEPLLAPHFLEIRDSLVSQDHDKAPGCSAGDPGLIPGSGKSPGEGNGNPFQ